MNAPDKIFIDKDCNFNEHDSFIAWSYEPPFASVEYIRKDALLEWLRKEYETISWYYEKMKHVTGYIGDNSSSGKAEAYKKVIDKIESL